MTEDQAVKDVSDDVSDGCIYVWPVVAWPPLLPPLPLLQAGRWLCSYSSQCRCNQLPHLHTNNADRHSEGSTAGRRVRNRCNVEKRGSKTEATTITVQLCSAASWLQWYSAQQHLTMGHARQRKPPSQLTQYRCASCWHQSCKLSPLAGCCHPLPPPPTHLQIELHPHHWRELPNSHPELPVPKCNNAPSNNYSACATVTPLEHNS